MISIRYYLDARWRKLFADETERTSKYRGNTFYNNKLYNFPLFFLCLYLSRSFYYPFLFILINNAKFCINYNMRIELKRRNYGALIQGNRACTYFYIKYRKMRKKNTLLISTRGIVNIAVRTIIFRTCRRKQRPRGWRGRVVRAPCSQTSDAPFFFPIATQLVPLISAFCTRCLLEHATRRWLSLRNVSCFFFSFSRYEGERMKVKRSVHFIAYVYI